MVKEPFIFQRKRKIFVTGYLTRNLDLRFVLYFVPLVNTNFSSVYFFHFQLIIPISTGTCSRDITRCSRFTRLWVSLVTQDTPLITPPTTRAASPTHPIHRGSHIHRYVHHSVDRLNKIIFLKQECIPVGCVPSAAMAVSPATHAPCHAHPPTIHTPHLACPLPHMPPYHTFPLPCMPPAMDNPLPCMPPPCHAHTLPLPHIPPAMHAPCHGHPSAMHMPLPCMPPCHACPFSLPHMPPLPCTSPPPMDRMTDSYENITFPQLLLRTVIKPDIDSSFCVQCRKQLARNRNRFGNKHETFHKMINLLNGYRQ